MESATIEFTFLTGSRIVFMHILAAIRGGGSEFSAKRICFGSVTMASQAHHETLFGEMLQLRLSQTGPINFLLRSRCSSAFVLQPKTCENVFPGSLSKAGSVLQ